MTFGSPATVLVVSGDDAVRAAVCTIVEQLGAPTRAVATGTQALALVKVLAAPVVVLVDGCGLDRPLDGFRDELGDACASLAPVVATIRSDEDKARWASADLRSSVASLVVEAMRRLEEQHAEPPSGEPLEAPTLETAAVWDEIAIEHAKVGDFISWVAVAGRAPTVAFVAGLRPLQLGTMPGWVLEAENLLTWLPHGARVLRARVAAP